MGPSHLTLAALATAAVPGLEPIESHPHTASGRGDYDSAVVISVDRQRWLVQVPANPSADARQQAEVAALRALTSGVRDRLPFDAPAVAGQVPIGATQATVMTFVEGERAPLHSLTPGGTLTLSIGHSIAALHSLPVSVVVDAGLPSFTASDCLRQAVAVLDRAEGTGLVPPSLLERWDRILTTGELWQFQPSVIHSNLSMDTILVSQDVVVGLLEWAQLRVGDPAADLQWLLSGTRPEVSETAFDAYWIARQVPVDREFRIRARFYAELELAQWLLHGTDSSSPEIVDDAVQMLHALLDRVQLEPAPLVSSSRQPMGLEDVRAMLSQQHPSIYPQAPNGHTHAQDE